MSTTQEFSQRHIGPNSEETQQMLQTLGFSTLHEMAGHVLPKAIRTQHPFSLLGEGRSEFGLLSDLQQMVQKNKVFKSYLGMGFHDTITPTVIQRNILENPVWYTAYTPYQPEIAQGRLEALLNFQTVIADLTGMEIANASLLDEGTAAAEAIVMAHSLAKNKSSTFIASAHLHPHVLAVLKTRSEPLGLKMLVQSESSLGSFAEPVFAVILSYPHSEGSVNESLSLYEKTAQSVRDQGGLLIVDADLLSLTLLTPPGEWGADIVVGNSQRFGVPLGNGGPHAAFLATRDSFKRSMPGRLVGVSVDAQGRPALRLALQTREQHIRREKATSNICTAQVLLANMASMYAVYHGPQGLKKIALRIHLFTAALHQGLLKLGLKIRHPHYFDTLVIETPKAHDFILKAEQQGLNFRLLDNHALSISLNETVDAVALQEILQVFHPATLPFTVVSLLPAIDKGGNADTSQKPAAIPVPLQRTSSYLVHPVFNTHRSETQLLRYIHALQNKDLTLTHAMIPLGSCTMKLNATTELVPVSWPQISRLHPFAPAAQMQGSLTMIKDLEDKLADITGFAAVTLQPNAGSQGEYAGLLAIRAYHQSRQQGQRNICLIPSSAHGTNPASAVMAGMQVVVVRCDDKGNVDGEDMLSKAKQYQDTLAALMITYPSTHGVFEESIKDICQIIHQYGGQVYMDGANLNALVGLCRPGELGVDVSHMNLHKTFSIPHGGGGPGVGPIGVAAHLQEFLPSTCTDAKGNSKDKVGQVSSAPYGSASILPISWAYITMMGFAGLQQATLISILNANYIAKKLSAYYPILYKGREGLVAHECILDLRPLKKSSGIDVVDIAKRLMDYGFHAPTMSFPVAGTLMIEPTESESKAELDRFCQAMILIRQEIQMVEDKKIPADNNPLVNAPHTASAVTADSWDHPYSRQTAAYPAPWIAANKFWPAVARIDNAYGDRNIICSCPPLDSYSQN